MKSLWADLAGVAFEQGYVDAGGVRTRYLASGSADKPVLIFLHGVGGHAEAYVRNLRAHGEHFRTYAIDMYGHGYTDRARVNAEIPVYLEHLLAFLDAVGASTCRLSGESLGGWVAAKFALAHPARVERLVLNTPGGSHSNAETLNRLRNLTTAAFTDPTRERIRARLEFLMLDKTMVHDDLVAARQTIYAASGMAESIDKVTILMESETRARNRLTDEDLVSIAVPTMVLWTSDDPMADVVEGRRVASLIPGAKFVVMDNCGHWPQFEDAATFNDIHIRYMRGLPIDDVELNVRNGVGKIVA
jgi:2-hydroxy-6-oxonona-2,4-dienedioate hydrolase